MILTRETRRDTTVEAVYIPEVLTHGNAYVEQIPEAQMFLKLAPEVFETIQLIRCDILSATNMRLEFDVLAPTDLVSRLRKTLIEMGLLKRRNFICRSSIPDGVRQTIGFFKSQLLIVLNVKRA